MSRAAARTPVSVVETLARREQPPQAAQVSTPGVTPAETPSPTPEVTTPTPPAQILPVPAETPALEVTSAPPESAVPKSDPVAPGVQAPRKRVVKPVAARTERVTMRSRAGLGQERFQVVCKAASDSAQQHGTVTVTLISDPNTKVLKDIALAYVPPGLKLENDDCIKELKKLPMLADFSQVDDFTPRFSYEYKLKRRDR